MARNKLLGSLALVIAHCVEASLTLFRTHRRIKLQKVLQLTKDYALALNMSAMLHLDEQEWLELFPHFDPARLFNPPTFEKLDRIQRRVEKLEDA